MITFSKLNFSSSMRIAHVCPHFSFLLLVIKYFKRDTLLPLTRQGRNGKKLLQKCHLRRYKVGLQHDFLGSKSNIHYLSLWEFSFLSQEGRSLPNKKIPLFKSYCMYDDLLSLSLNETHCYCYASLNPILWINKTAQPTFYPCSFSPATPTSRGCT